MRASRKRQRESPEAALQPAEDLRGRFEGVYNPTSTENNPNNSDDLQIRDLDEMDWSKLFNPTLCTPQERYQLLLDGSVPTRNLEPQIVDRLVQSLLKDYQDTFARAEELERKVAGLVERVQELEYISTEYHSLKQDVLQYIETSESGLREFVSLHRAVHAFSESQIDRLEVLSRMTGYSGLPYRDVEQGPLVSVHDDPDTPGDSENARTEHDGNLHAAHEYCMRFDVKRIEYEQGKEPVHAIRVDCMHEEGFRDTKGNLVETGEIYFLKKDVVRGINSCLPPSMAKKDLTGLIRGRPKSFNIDRTVLRKVEWRSSDPQSELWLPTLEGFATSNPSRSVAFIHESHIPEIALHAVNQVNAKKVKDAEIWQRALEALHDILSA